MQPRPWICDRIEELTTHERKNLIAVVQELLDTVGDAAAGYETAAKVVNEPELAKLFRECAADRRAATAELAGCLVELGSQATSHPSVGAGVHRGLMALRAAIAHGQPAAVLSECERGEHVALGRFERALTMKMTSRVASALLDQSALMRGTRNSFERMRHPW